MGETTGENHTRPQSESQEPEPQEKKTIENPRERAAREFLQDPTIQEIIQNGLDAYLDLLREDAKLDKEEREFPVSLEKAKEFFQNLRDLLGKVGLLPHAQRYSQTSEDGTRTFRTTLGERPTRPVEKTWQLKIGVDYKPEEAIAAERERTMESLS